MSAASLPIHSGIRTRFGCPGCSGSGICQTTGAHLSEANPDPTNEALLPPLEHVLSTLEQDGSRRWLRPRLSMGQWWRKRRVIAYLLMVVFVVVPHLRIGGKPLILLDIAGREFTVLGRTFLPTDTLVLALLILSVFVTIVLATALAGRVWCGWACPQTVYMEFLFRPIDRFFEGTVGKGGKPAKDRSPLWQVARFLVYLFLCMFLAHTFLAYFVGTDKLAVWVRSTPTEHPVAFLVMGATTLAMMFDFLFFREQMCLIACPYGRFQSVMLDEQSTIVAYDHVRGEPRKKGKHEANSGDGDCVDCNQCVVVCPTGIDIRDGLQMECINCTQCIDACDNVMDRVGSPRGLIRYSSQDSIAGMPKRLLRARTIVYPLILTAVLGGFVFAVSTKGGFDARINRGKGSPVNNLGGGQLSNTFLLRLVNRTNEPQQYAITMGAPEGATIEVIDPDSLKLAAGETKTVALSVVFSSILTLDRGSAEAHFSIRDGSQHERQVDFHLIGPH